MIPDGTRLVGVGGGRNPLIGVCAAVQLQSTFALDSAGARARIRSSNMHALRLVLAALLAVLAACSAGTMDAEWHFHGSARRDVIDRPMVDPDTPRSAYNITNSAGTKQFNLMFSDEFNEDGRNFSSQAPQREPYWTAMDFYNVRKPILTASILADPGRSQPPVTWNTTCRRRSAPKAGRW